MNTRPSVALVTSLVTLALLAAAAVVAFATGVLGSATVSAEELDRVLIVAASPDENGDVVGQIIASADLSSGQLVLEPFSPATPVTIPGTSFSELKDAYPFGGGKGTAEALARAEGGEALPYVAISAGQLSSAVRAAGGVRLTLPEALSVFDGETLYSLEEGQQNLDADELQALFKGAAYLSESNRTKLDAELAEMLRAVLAASPETIDAADTNLDESARARLKAAL